MGVAVAALGRHDSLAGPGSLLAMDLGLRNLTDVTKGGRRGPTGGLAQ